MATQSLPDGPWNYPNQQAYFQRYPELATESQTLSSGSNSWPGRSKVSPPDMGFAPKVNLRDKGKGVDPSERQLRFRLPNPGNVPERETALPLGKHSTFLHQGPIPEEAEESSVSNENCMSTLSAYDEVPHPTPPELDDIEPAKEEVELRPPSPTADGMPGPSMPLGWRSARERFAEYKQVREESRREREALDELRRKPPKRIPLTEKFLMSLQAARQATAPSTKHMNLEELESLYRAKHFKRTYEIQLGERMLSLREGELPVHVNDLPVRVYFDPEATSNIIARSVIKHLRLPVESFSVNDIAENDSSYLNESVDYCPVVPIQPDDWPPLPGRFVVSDERIIGGFDMVLGKPWLMGLQKRYQNYNMVGRKAYLKPYSSHQGDDDTLPFPPSRFGESVPMFSSAVFPTYGGVPLSLAYQAQSDEPGPSTQYGFQVNSLNADSVAADVDEMDIDVAQSGQLIRQPRLKPSSLVVLPDLSSIKEETDSEMTAVDSEGDNASTAYEHSGSSQEAQVDDKDQSDHQITSITKANHSQTSSSKSL
ncbi:hypothetical protein DL93DRAFT_2173722 [Clavulina sp. PMI_390]|nr:hypothetical protein DL93DRAFT_2173722 [Clavulina sp. PMI_390]